MSLAARAFLLFGRILLALVVAAVLLASLALVFHRSLMKAYAPVILDAVAKEYRDLYEVGFDYDTYSITGVSDFTIKGVSLTDLPTGRTFLTCDSLRVRSNFTALSLRGADPKSAVTSVVLEHPVMSLGREEGRWTAEGLFAPARHPRRQFPGRFAALIRDGEVIWSGGEVADGVEIPPCRVGGLQGDYVLDGDGMMAFALAGTLTASAVEPAAVSIKGVFEPDTYLFRLTCESAGLDLRLAGPYVKQFGISRVEGLSDVKASLLIGPPAGESGWSLIGSAQVRDGALHYDDLELDAVDLAGDLHFSNKSVMTTGLSGLVEGSSVSVQGRIGCFGVTRYDLAAEISNLSLGLAGRVLPSLKDLPLQGSVNAHFRFSGVPEDWDAVVQADSPQISVMGVPLDLKNLFVLVSGSEIDVRVLEASTGGGAVSGRGMISLAGGEPQFEFNISGDRINPESLTSLLRPALPAGFRPGPLSAELAVRGTPRAPEFDGVLLLPDAQVPFSKVILPMSISLPFKAEGERVQFAGAVAEGSGVTAVAQGSIRSWRQADVSLAVAFDDPGLVECLSGFPLNGKLALAGDMIWSSGSDGISFKGEGVLSEGRIGSIEVGRLSASVGVSGGLVAVSNLEGLMSGAHLKGEITVPLGQSAEGVGGGFHVAGLDIGPFLPDPYSRVVSTGLDIAGNLSFADSRSGALEVDLTLRETSARVGENTLFTGDNGISVKLALADDFSRLESITVYGHVNSQAGYVPVFAGRRLTPYAAEVVRRLSALLSGRSEEDGEGDSPVLPGLSGDLAVIADIQDPLGRASGNLSLTGENLTIEGYEISRVTARLEGEGDGVWNVELDAASDSSGSIEISGTLTQAGSLAETGLMLSAAIRDSGLNQLFRMFGLTGFGRFSGSISGSGTIGGTLSSPVVSEFRLNMSESEAFGIPLTEGNAVFGYEEPVLRVTGLELRGENGFEALGSGSIDVTAPSLASASMVARVDRLNLARVRNLLGRTFPLDGIVSGTVQLARDALGPKVLYSATVDDSRVAVYGETLALGRITLDAVTRPGVPSVTVNRLEFARDGQSLTVSGSVPSRMTPFTTDVLRQLRLDIRSDTGYKLDVPAGMVAAGVTWQGGVGPVSLNLAGASLQGDLSLDISDVRLGQIVLVNSLQGTLHAVNSVISASPDDVKLRGEGWEAGVSGQANLLALLAGIPGSVRFAVSQSAKEPLRLSGQGYSFDIVLGTGDEEPSLAVQGTLQNLSALVKGRIYLAGGRIDTARVPAIPVLRRPSAAGPLSFDLRMALQGQLVVQQGSSYNFVFDSGALTLSGPALDPVLSGTLTASEGWLDIMGNHFVLTEPLQLTFSPLYRFDPHVTASAQTTLREVRSPQNYGEQLVITARIDGRLSGTMSDFELSSVPSLSRDQLLAALAYEDIVLRTIGASLFGGGSGPGLSDLGFEGVAVPIATSYISRLIRTEAGFADFEVSIDPEQRVYVYLEKEVLDKLVMYYQQVFGPDVSSYLLGMRYQWQGRSWLGFEFNSDLEKASGQVQYIIPLD